MPKQDDDACTAQHQPAAAGRGVQVQLLHRDGLRALQEAGVRSGGRGPGGRVPQVGLPEVGVREQVLRVLGALEAHPERVAAHRQHVPAAIRFNQSTLSLQPWFQVTGLVGEFERILGMLKNQCRCY